MKSSNLRILSSAPRKESAGLSNSEQLPLLTRTMNLVGAIELSAEDNLLAHEAY